MMIEHIKALLTGRGGGGAGARASSEIKALREAVAALLVQAAHLDGTFGEAERACIETLLAERFSLAPDDLAALMDTAERMCAVAVDNYEFTRTISQQFDHDARVGIVEMLWDVAYADGKLHPYEGNLLRRVAGLLYVTDQESGAARKRVVERRGA
jgi:uncharacterized tellurite resistance protein B-like protein